MAKELKAESFVKMPSGEVVPLDSLTAEQKTRFRKGQIKAAEESLSIYWSGRMMRNE